jgi:hypothetical protein
MVTIYWVYSANKEIQPNPYIELECSEAELAEAKEKLSEEEYELWVQNVASGVSHSEAMEWAIEEAAE